ncbi:polysaccharide biosynthesis tyrosine autokinase [Leptolyngbya sp. CCNP1308]|uniref:polysaccharide biosynthesis tyrosine autokinase n=1 Tax=Leptolyngbya sp. CCNP1308 TaxID=3110255 RepID=UPI002B21477A|nr:polysaccharide biosynthesis tyrosine autokinase [Leptolyngbya sp. CCNP1308]MEA5448625.1 polysaccharide biosynthesis tyrosine autokinase [Leptolyngbya sp. CCNP1308]
MKAQTLPSLPPAVAAPVAAGSSQEGGLDFSSLLSTLRRRALLIAGIAATVTAAAGVRAYLSPPSYSAAFEVLIQPLSAETEVISTLSDVPINQRSSDLSLADQTRILASPGVLQPVINDLRAKGLEGCVPETQASLTGRSNEELQNACYARVKSRLSIQLTKDSRIFQASYYGDSAQDVEYVATLIARTFLDYGLASRQRDLQQGLSFLDDKIPDARQRVDELQSDLQDLRQNSSLITPADEGNKISEQVAAFENQYRAVLIELEENLTRYEELQQQLTQQPQDASVSSVLSANSRYQSLVQELLALDSQIAQASTLFLNNSPDMQVLQEQRRNLLALMSREGANTQRELMGQIDVLAAREAALSDTLADLNVDVGQLAEVTRQFTDLERELTLANNNLGQLLERRDTLQIEAAQRELPWELITPATLSTDIANLQNSLVLGALLGLLLGTGLALALDSQKDVLYTPRDLKRVTPVPILGVIPNNGAVEQGYDEQYLISLYQSVAESRATTNYESNGKGSKHRMMPTEDLYIYREAFRSLVANLQRLDADRPLRSLVISSADNQLADSTTAAYLAWAAAELGNRVLLIDADFRFPHLHNFLELPNQQGFANILAGELDLKNVIKRSPTEPNLFVLTTGSTAVDPARLLSSTKMKQFVAKTESYFDLVIYDSPPFSEYADAALLSAETSGLVLVSHLGTVKSAQLEQTLEKLWISKIPLIGLIAKEAASKMALLPV